MMKITGLLPDHVANQTGDFLGTKKDCTKQFSEMLESYRTCLKRPRDYPMQQNEIPAPLEQQTFIIQNLKEQRELLEKQNNEMRGTQTLHGGQGPDVSPDSMLVVFKDIDNQDKKKAIYNINEEQLCARVYIENWIKSRKNAGMGMLNKMKDMAFAKEIFKAWDTNNKGYLTTKQFSEQLCGLGLSTDNNFVHRLLVTLRSERQKNQSESIEVLTLMDFLQVFAYNNFAKRACEVIKQEFRSNLTTMIAKQKMVENKIREQKNAKKQINPIKKTKFLIQNGSQNSFADGPNANYAQRSQPGSSMSLNLNINMADFPTG